MVSTKFYAGYDEEVYITEWAEYGNMAVDRLKALEIEFLDAMDWKIYVSNETFFKKLKDIECVLAEREARDRGWLTYTELCTLMPSIDLIRKAISYSALLAVSYTAGVIALAGAFFVASHVPGSYLCDRRTATTTSPAAVETHGVLNETVTDPVAVVGGAGERNYSELEERLIMNGVDWDPISSVDEDGQRNPLNRRGTDYWGTMGSEFNDTTTGHTMQLGGELTSVGIEELAHGIIRKRENDTTMAALLGVEEWSPFKQSSSSNDLSFLSYLWLKFL